jgi:LysR family nitrogen assimilation transcriptional regulator
MDLRQLRYFIAIVEAGSVSRAAARLRVAQPALSQHVLAMEAALGLPLLTRHARGVLPTEAGLRLLERAREIEARFATLPDHVRGAAIPAGEVRFGMPATINEQLGVGLIEAGLARFPAVRIRISEAMSGFVLGWLRDGTVDLALLYNVADEKGLTLHHALTEEIQLFGVPGLSGAPAGPLVTLAAALRLPLILPGPAHGLRELIEAAARGAGGTPRPVIEIDSYRQIKQLAARGIGFGLLPRTAIAQEIAEGTFRAWQVTRPVLMRRIFLGYASARPLSTASRAIGQLSWDILETLVAGGSWAAEWAGIGPLGLHPSPAISGERGF